MEVIDKITAVVNAATVGLFGTVAKQIVPGVKCGLQLFTVTKCFIKLIGETNDAPTAKDKIKALLANSDVAKTD
ncbi:hypothetical protein Poli38472_011649 [Pythium oligandrum]|uniref:Uncharacterized protein n=1 Tax=Pythium oligandrum TaxID=41045 RepID=A0A8K1FL13_PYTOL|nr:hypothetical protein Poli38472_011649 [Pythium oligandrum]|eukprot:TMW64769.1 hypothetical protein Poli38472_011649 [Pythium oligandrum]